MQMTKITRSYSRPTVALALLFGALPGLILLVTSTTILVEDRFVYDVKRVLQLCLLTVLFAVAALNPGIRGAFGAQLQRIPTWVKVLFGLIVAIGITSSVVNATSNQHMAYSLLEVALLTLLVPAALVIAACRIVSGRLFDQMTVTLLAMTTIAVGTQELLGVAAAIQNGVEYYFRISLMHYSWPRFFNQVQAWTLPVLAALPFVWSKANAEILSSKVFGALVCLLALGLSWYIVFMTGGRGIALSLIAAFATGFLVFPLARKQLLMWHLPGLLLGLALFTMVSHNMERVASQNVTGPATISEALSQISANPSDWHSNDGSASNFARQSIFGRMTLDPTGRLYMWKGSIGDIHQKPLLGNGPMNYACSGPEHRAGHPHSFALQFGGEWGVPAALFLLIILAYSAVQILKTIRTNQLPTTEKLTASLLSLGVLAAVGYSFLSGVMVMPASQIAGLYIAGWLIALTQNSSQQFRMRKLTTLVVLVALVALSTSATTFAIAEFRKSTYDWPSIAGPDQKIPRFWQEGKVCKYFDKQTTSR